jgi:hypothetical protein
VRPGCLLFAALALSTPAFGQSRVELSGGVAWTGGFDAGGGDALLSRGTPGSTLTLFETSTRMEPAAGVVARATIFLTSRLGVDARVEYSRPELRTTISDDFENADGDEAVSSLSSYLFGGSITYQFGDARLAPFVLAGAGHLRQLDEDEVSVVTGMEYHAGGGVRYRMSPHFAVRADAVVSSRDKSFAFEEKRRTLPAVTASLAYRF